MHFQTSLVITNDVLDLVWLYVYFVHSLSSTCYEYMHNKLRFRFPLLFFTGRYYLSDSCRHYYYLLAHDWIICVHHVCISKHGLLLLPTVYVCLLFFLSSDRHGTRLRNQPVPTQSIIKASRNIRGKTRLTITRTTDLTEVVKEDSTPDFSPRGMDERMMVVA